MVQLRGGDVAGAQATTARIRDAGAAGEVQRQIVVTRIASGALNAARELALRIKDDFYQARALGDVAAADARAGNAGAAEALARRSRKSQRPEIYGRIALAKAEAGDLNGAITTLPKIDDELERAILQREGPPCVRSAGDRTQAQRLFTDAVSTLDAAQDRNHRKAITWSQLARIQWLAGEATGATQCLRHAIVHVGDMPLDSSAMKRSMRSRAIRRTWVRGMRHSSPQPDFRSGDAGLADPRRGGIAVRFAGGQCAHA